ncbi:hypothetical protein ACIRRH_43135 [Kitasatospora sp. NPDC101235]|uniref:hypothetical protein n=1 Tax=Kitasatospora sp. NPDC101235 TaxID=3364101 RepID=UPI00381CF4A0
MAARGRPCARPGTVSRWSAPTCRRSPWCWTPTTSNNTGGLEAIGNRIGGSLTVIGNSGTGPFPEDNHPEIEGNTIAGSLACSGNTPPPTDDGHPNTVTGARAGQCSTL